MNARGEIAISVDCDAGRAADNSVWIVNSSSIGLGLVISHKSGRVHDGSGWAEDDAGFHDEAATTCSESPGCECAVL